MPRSFSGASSGARPAAQLFRVPTLPEKQIKDGEAPEDVDIGDMDCLDDMQDWVNSMLQDAPKDEDGASPAVGPVSPPKATPPPALLLSTYEKAMMWSTTDASSPKVGMKPAAALSGPGVPSGFALPSHLPPPPIFGEHEDFIFEVRPQDTVVVHLLTPAAYGYTPAEITGQPLLAITPSEDHSAMLHALQVLLRMDEIARLTSGAMGQMQPGAQGLQVIRVIHPVIAGLGRPHRLPEIVMLDSHITTLQGQHGGVHCLFRSRRASQLDAAERKFRMLIGNTWSGA